MSRLTFASLNTRGMPVARSQLPARYALIGAAFEASDVDVVTFQEILTYYHLRQLTRHLPSYWSVAYRPSVAGPAGGLVTVARTGLARSEFVRFPLPPVVATAGLPRLTRFKAPLKGMLLTRLAHPRLTVVNTHLLANRDGDWSESNRFSVLHRGQLAALARVVGTLPGPSIVCGDFNIARDSTLHRDFMIDTGLADAFDGHCPPTFHADYLSPGDPPHCIDFILLAGAIKVESSALIFTGKLPLASGPVHVSDHLGLCVRALVST